MVTVAMFALVEAGQSTQERGRAVGGDGAFGGTRDGWGVVTGVDDGGVASVVSGGHER